MGLFKTWWMILAVSGVLIASSLAGTGYSSAEVWDFDSINPVHARQTPNQIAAADVYASVTRANDLWNAHDLEGYLDCFWRSPALVIVEEGNVINGWQDFHDRSVRGFNRPESMGQNSVTRVQVRMMTPDLAFVLTHWSLGFAGSSHLVVGVDSAYMQRVDGVWKIINGHTSYLDM
ncbi:MAG: hypothetical protein JO069_18685 [Verrucomicrobia bacterium]|nr:hypothetical protein [Verrucomicrobiota bacterium]